MTNAMNWKIVVAATLTGAGLLTLASCKKEIKAPDVADECYFIGHPSDGSLKFNAIAHNQPDPEHCAIYVYNARLDMLRTGTAGEVTEGAYNGSFLWATNREVRFSLKYDSPRFPLLVRANNKLVKPGAVVEDVPSDAPRTIEIPDNLPQKP